MTTAYFDAGDVMVHRFAVGHNVLKDGVSVAKPWPLPRCMYSAGAVACSAADLLKFARFYLDGGVAHDGTRLVSQEAIAAMWSPQFDVQAGLGDAVGYSWFITERDGTNCFSHGGATVGQISAFEVIPEHDFAFCIFTNAATGRQMNPHVATAIREQHCGIKPAILDPIVAWDEVNSAEITGTYRNRIVQLAFTLREGVMELKHTQLLAFPEPDAPIHQLPLMSVGLLPNGHLRGLDGPIKDMELQVIRDEDGSIGWIRSGGRVHRRE